MSSGTKVAVVTGASSGAGEGIARYLAKQGVHVVLVARREKVLEGVRDDIIKDGGKASVKTADTSNYEQVKSLADYVSEKFGAPDYVVNCAGAWAFQDFIKSDHTTWDPIININIRGYLSVIRELVPLMVAKGRGHVVNITSDSERHAWPSMVVYTGSKFFWAGAAESLRKELKGTGVKVTNVLPGFIDTPGLMSTFEKPDQAAAMKKFEIGEPADYIKQRDKMLKPEDVGKCVWDVVSNPDRVFIHDVLLSDSLQ